MSRALLALCLLTPLLALARPPRLTLWITVDGLSSDVLQRNRVHYKAGLSRLLTQGAFFPTSRYAYAEPGTAAGHSTLATGANPWRHGIIANGVFDRSAGKELPVFADARYPVLGAPIGTEDASPLALKAESIGDRLRMSSQDRAKVIAVAGKARAAIPFAGRSGQAWWFSDSTGQFVTGTWYLKDFPQWVREVNEQKPAEKAFGVPWTLSLPPTAYVGSDDRGYEADFLGLGRKFPHPTTAGLASPGPQSNAVLGFTPAINDLLVTFAKAAIAGEKLGADEHADLLSVSFSGFDRVQHLFGPYSWEAQDTLVKLDRALGELIAAAERAAGGRNNLLIVFSADHGSAAIPEEWAEAGQPGTRVSPKTLAQSVEKQLRAKYGQELGVFLDETDLYLSGRAMQGKESEIRRAAASLLSAQPEIAFAVAREDLATAEDLGALAPSLRKGFFPQRSGDVAFVLKPFHVLNDHNSGTSHGTPWRYDTDVPVIFFGKGIRAGTYGQIIDPTDLAPTVATVMEIGIPASAEGAVRHEVLTGK